MDKEALKKAYTKALAYAENGGAPDVGNLKAGATGELKSVFQFTPDTWKNYAKQVLGDENAPMNPDTETYVAHKKVSDWVDKGYTIKQIASMWNAGSGEPDAYTGKFSNGRPSKSINTKYGVKFDVPGYSKRVEEYAKEFLSEKEPKIQTPANNQALDKLVGIIKQSNERKPMATPQPASILGNTGLIGQLTKTQPSPIVSAKID